jgi:hypothetical protein
MWSFMICTSPQISTIFWLSSKAEYDGFGMRHVWVRGDNDMVLSGNEKKEGHLVDQVIQRRVTVGN